MIFNKITEKHGFKAMPLKESYEWIQLQLKNGRSVINWNPEECFVFAFDETLSSEFKELLEPLGDNKFKMKGNISLPRIMSLFLEGVADFLVCSDEYIEFPLLAHELMQLIYVASQKANQNISARVSSDNEKLKQVKQNPFLLNLWGKLLSVEKKYNEAAQSFRDSIESMNEFGEPYGNLGTLLWTLGKQREGFILITEALLKNPYSVSAQLNFFDAGYEMREYSAMTKVIESLLNDVSEYPEFRHHLAICYQKLGKESEAVDVLKNIIKDFPGDADAKKILDTINQ